MPQELFGALCKIHPGMPTLMDAFAAARNTGDPMSNVAMEGIATLLTTADRKLALMDLAIEVYKTLSADKSAFEEVADDLTCLLGAILLGEQVMLDLAVEANTDFLEILRQHFATAHAVFNHVRTV